MTFYSLIMLFSLFSFYIQCMESRETPPMAIQPYSIDQAIRSRHTSITSINGGYDEREQDLNDLLIQMSCCPSQPIVAQTLPDNCNKEYTGDNLLSTQKRYTIETVIIKNQLPISIIATIKGQGSKYIQGIFNKHFDFAPEPVTIGPLGMNYFQRRTTGHNKKNNNVDYILNKNLLILRSKRYSNRNLDGDPRTEHQLDAPFAIDSTEDRWSTIVVSPCHNKNTCSWSFNIRRMY